MQPKKKHIPQRTCIACRQVKEKRNLIRIVKMPEETIAIDETGKAQGRGAYLCKEYICWEKGLNNSIGRALKVAITQQDKEKLELFALNFSRTESSKS